ncbi:MAG: helix-hairpin-helix domain-containing protein, partial [Chitinophagaceae bacterium]|nr:helix-hairpin-helix domain-containing protein [Chitinophagaceae bacterium]
IFLPRLFSKSPDVVAIKQDSTLLKAIDTMVSHASEDVSEIESSIAYQYEPTQTSGFTNAELFSFDPNTLSLQGWKRLGLNDRTIRTINNYRSKGGKFYKPEDLKKIWGMPQGFYERVENYITITSVQRNENSYTAHYTPTTNYETKERRIAVVNINEADTSALIALPGIGSRLAARIVNFRDKLGGFYSVDQIRETYGLPDSTFQKIKPYLLVKGAVK